MGLTAPMSVTNGKFEREVIEHSRPVVVDFWSSACGHCARYNPEFDAAAARAGGPLKFVKVSSQDAPGLFRRFAIGATPTTVVFRGGVAVARRSGHMSREELLAWLGRSLQARAA